MVVVVTVFYGLSFFFAAVATATTVAVEMALRALGSGLSFYCAAVETAEISWAAAAAVNFP